MISLMFSQGINYQHLSFLIKSLTHNWCCLASTLYSHANCPQIGLIAFRLRSTHCYSRLQKSCNTQAEQWKTTIDLPHMNLIIFPTSACPFSLFKHSKSIVVFHCSACLLQDFCNLLYHCKSGRESGEFVLHCQEVSR